MGIPGDPKDIHINVVLNSETPGDFRIEPEPPGSLPIGPDGELIFENDRHSGFFIYFDLKTPVGLDYVFPLEKAQLHEAVWSELGAGACPTTAKWEVFVPRKVLKDGKTLKVRNTNVKPDLGKFGYTLRVTKDGGKTFLPLDPGGDNKNGPISASGSMSALAFLGGAAFGVLATLGTQALLQG